MGRPKAFNREEVLEAALPLFWKRGFADTGLQDLEKATGVNKSGLYSEFKNKEDLFLEALRYYFSHRPGRELLLADPPGWDNIEKFLKYRMTSNDDSHRGCFAVNSMRETEVLPDEAAAILIEGRARLKERFARNIAAEKTKMPTDALVELVSTFFSGLCIEHNVKHPKAAVLRKIDDFMNLIRTL